MEEKEVMKNKVVKKLLMFGVSSSVALSSSIGVAAAAMDNTEVEVIVENTEETTAEAEEESSETAETEDTETEEEAGETAETEDTVTEETQTEETQTEETSRNVWVCFATEEGELLDDVACITLEAGDTYFNTSDVNVPEGYEVCNMGDVSVPADVDSVTISVRKVAATRIINVSLVTKSGEVISANQQIEIGRTDTVFNTSLLAVPEGYELRQTGDVYIGDGDTLNVYVRKKEAEQKSIIVNYVLENDTNVGTGSVTVDGDANYINTSSLKDIPYGYELVNVGDIPFEGNSVNILVKEKEYTKDVIVNYVDEAENPVYTSSIKLSKDATYFNTNILKDVPYGWVLASVGDIPVDENNTASVVVRQKKYTKDVIVNYVDEAGNPVYTSSIKLNEDATYFNTSILKDVPYGWELANIGDITVDADNTATVVVREKEYTKDVIVNYVDEAGNPVYTSSIKLSKDATYFNTSILKDIPYGWVLVNVGDIPVDGNNTATVVVRQKKYTKNIEVQYVTKEGEVVATGSLTVDEDSTYINTSILKDVPSGYKIAIVGDLPIENNIAKVTVYKDVEDPEEPENPDKPTNPDKPINPDKPTNPEEPENPDNPTDPEEPENPDNPTDPEEPENPDNPTDPEEPGNPDNPTDPEKPEDSEQAGQSQKPGDNSELDKTESKPEIKTSNPKTGDPTSAFPLIAGLLSSGSIMGLVEIIRRKRK